MTDPPTPAAADEVAAVLKALRIVVGHTPSPSRRIRLLSDGRVLEADTGMLGGGFFAGGVLTAIYLGSREVLTPSTVR